MPYTEILALCMIGAFFVLLLIGMPVAVCLGATGFVFGYMGFGSMLFTLMPRASSGWSPIIHFWHCPSSSSWGSCSKNPE